MNNPIVQDTAIMKSKSYGPVYLTYSCTLSGVTGTFDPPGISSTSTGSVDVPDSGA